MTAKRGAKPGNSNAKKNRAFADALRRVTAQDAQALRDIAESLVEQARNGDLKAIEMVADRLDGRPMQAQELSGPDGGPVQVAAIEFVNASNGQDTPEV